MYHIAYDDGKYSSRLILEGPGEHALALKPGMKLLVMEDFDTPAHTYLRGDQLELVERTMEAPHFRRCSLGNWVVKDKHFTSIWTNIEWAVDERILAPIYFFPASKLAICR